ncbi:MAG: hypothetical protein NC236_02745 [Mycoplasma sp.]|nr:hypothetical protein [Mycoplasma sp.]
MLDFSKQRNLISYLLIFFSATALIYGYTLAYGINSGGWVTPITFTYISNELVFSYIFIRVALNKHGQKLKIYQILITSWISVTFLVYWVILLPTAGPPSTFKDWLDTLLLHGITPILAIVLLVFDYKKQKNERIHYKFFPLVLILPLVFLFYQLATMFLFDEPIYGVLDIHSNSAMSVAIYYVLIAAIIFFFGWLYMFFHNRHSNKN